MRNLMLSALLLAAPCAHAANLNAEGISVLDAGGAPRSTYSNNEGLVLRQQVRNDAASASMIRFKFYVLSPSGEIRFRHEGNAAPGTPGLAQTQISGLNISQFYTVPGTYIFRGVATLDLETVTQEAQFTVSSPNLILTYPPSGARGLSDSPLILRWIGSGAARYRITVSDNAGLYNPVHTAVNTGEASYAYPQTPGEPRARLVGGQVYYWRVEGLDAFGNAISESNIYSFSMRDQGSAQSRNASVADLSLLSSAADLTQPLTFKAVVTNTGGTSETGMNLKFTLGGLEPAGSPQSVGTLGPGDRKEYTFTAYVPEGQAQSLAVACIDLFDDNVPDNCKTRLVSKDAGGAAPGGGGRKLSYEEMWEALKKRLGPDALKMLEGYSFETLTCTNCTGSGELAELIQALITGEARLIDASIVDPSAAASAGAAASARASAGEDGAPELQLDLSEAPPPADEWAGFTEALAKDKPSYFVLKSKSEWKKLWKDISTEELPDVDFGDRTVVGIVAGRKDRAETIRILSQRRVEDGVEFDYYMIVSPPDNPPPAAAYLFKSVPRISEKTGFKRLDIAK